MNLIGKRVIVTGAASGIGLATAALFAENGASVALNFLADDERGQSAVDSIVAKGGSAFAAPGSVGEEDDCEAMISRAIDQLGGLDYLINNAGISGANRPVAFSDLESITKDFWQRVMDVNLFAAFRCAKVAASVLKDSGGAIVNTASVAGLGGRASNLAYAASKAALINLTTNLARALAPEVRVNAVAPGLVDSPWIKSWSQERRELTKSQTLINMISEPSDIADVIVFLCAGTRMINAQTIAVNGGDADPTKHL